MTTQTTHPEHDEGREALKLEFHHLTWALRHREITPEKAMERIADFILAHTTKAVEEARKGLCNQKCANCFTLNKLDEADALFGKKGEA